MRSFNPLEYPISLAFPQRLAPSQWAEHVPFAMFLIEAVRPDCIVELGTHNGVSYCAFCQAIRSAGLSARAYAIDTWNGDAHTGPYGPEILDDLRRHHDPLYGDFSRLIRATFDEAVGEFADGEINLLHIDGFHTYEAVRHDFFHWLPKVRENGIILLHDVNVHEGDFGAWKLWDEVRNQFPSFSFTHQHGLGVLVKGSHLLDALRPFTGHVSEAVRLRDYFAQLGRRLSARIEKDQAIDELTRLVKAKEKEILDNWDQRERDIHHLWVLREQENNLLWLQIGNRDREIQGLRNQLTEQQQEQTPQAAAVTDDEPASATRRSHRYVKQPLTWLRRRTLGAYRIWQEEGARVLMRKVRQRLGLHWGWKQTSEGELHVTLDRHPPAWRVGKGNVFYLSGACYHSAEQIRRLEIIVDGRTAPVKISHMNRPEVLAFPTAPRHSVWSGFCALVPMETCADRQSVHVSIRAHTRCGPMGMKSLGDIPLVSTVSDAPTVNVPPRGIPPLIAVCMTTYNPSLELFQRQIDSIRNQTNRDWICIITDDGSDPEVYAQIQRMIGSDNRFFLNQNPDRLGFYRNFEKCLSMVPPEVRFIALSDHDDSWDDDKLDTLLGEFDDRTTLVYSDMRVVDESGRKLSDTYWVHRKNNHKSLASLFFANTITGAASMFRKELLDFLLPFPEQLGGAFHDHWLGCTALTLGRIKYLRRPLYDYVQHGSNVLGFRQPPRKIGLATVGQALKTLSPFNLRVRWNAYKSRAKDMYHGDVLRLEQIAGTLLRRCEPRLTDRKRRTLQRIERLDGSTWSIAWLLARSVIGFRRRSVTMGAENGLLRALAWKWGMTFISALRSRRSPGTVASPTVVTAVPDVFMNALERVETTEQKIAPLQIKVSGSVPRRINLLIPTIDFQYVFGGYITKFQLARRLAAEGRQVRIVLLDYSEYRPDRWRQQLLAYPGLENLLDCTEIVCAFDRRRPLECHPNDAFIATTWWTAHIANRAVRDLGRSHFVYLIQEFETYTFPMGTYAALADHSYTFPHYAMFSTEFLREYFRRHRLGVYKQGGERGDRDSIAFNNAITAVGTIAQSELATRRMKKLLFYARPEAHASRNMFEMGVAALRRAVAAGYFQGEWEFHGIGTVANTSRVPLGGATLQLLPRQNQDSYRETLRDHDVGLSLMYTPHPSLVPIEMASAGMLTVTNTCGNKTADGLAALSSNLIAVEPCIEAVQEGLYQAASKVNDFVARTNGASVKWATTWDDALNPDVMERLLAFLQRGSELDEVIGRAA